MFPYAICEKYDLDSLTLDAISIGMHFKNYGPDLYVDLEDVSTDTDLFIVHFTVDTFAEAFTVQCEMANQRSAVINDCTGGRYEVVVSVRPHPDYSVLDWREAIGRPSVMYTEVQFTSVDARDRFDRALALWQAAR